MGNPRVLFPPRDPAEHPNPTPQSSLVEELGQTADELRQLFTDIGMRPYRVFSVRVRWSGRKIGVGTATVVEETEFLPTPLVDLSPVWSEVKSAGKVEDGVATLREVSPRLTEDQVRGLFFQDKLGPGEEGFIEVVHDARDGVTERRRFTVRGVPVRKESKFQWTVRLQRARKDRHRDGTPDVRTERPERILNPLLGETE